MQKRILRIATRKSPLALWQAEHVKKQLLQHWPDLSIELLPMTTSGDQFMKDRLLVAGGKGLFVKELEEALLDGRADLAVHSMKDVPADLPSGLFMAAICKRDNPFDAFISTLYPDIHSLPTGAVVGTASLRRQSQLLALRPDLNIQTLRGNINTRLQKIEEGLFDAIILAAAGLERMEMQQHISQLFTKDEMLPACGQGALGVECREDDKPMLDWLQPVHHEITATCVTAERKVNALLGGNCHVPLAVYCYMLDENTVTIEAKILSEDGKVMMQDKQTGSASKALLLAQQCAEQLIANGAEKLLGIQS